MIKRNPITVLVLCLAFLSLISCSPKAEKSVEIQSALYDDLVDLFGVWREFQKPPITDGIYDYSAAAMKEQRLELEEIKNRLAAIDPSSWPVSQQVDYHIVRAEMNGLDFDHRVLKPWSRNPCFYAAYYSSPSDVPALEGPWKYGTLCLWKYSFPLEGEDREKFQIELQAIPAVLEQARKNLTEDAKDLWFLGMRMKKKESEFLENFARRMEELHPGLVADVVRAQSAVDQFRSWLEKKQKAMKASSGIGVENYNWYMKNVHLIPYTWDEFHTMVQNEYDRAITFLKLEEHKNRDLPAFALTSSEEENAQRQRETAAKIMTFLRENEIITVPDDLPPLPPEQYPRMWDKSAYLRPGYRGYFEETNDREPMTNVLHVLFGHYYVGGRKIWYQERDTRPIRGAVRLFDMHEARSEALAFGIEEWLLQAGLFDERPRSKEIAYIWLAFRTARALSDLRMHSNEYSLEEGLKNFSEGIPYPWADVDSDAVWWDIEETLRAPGHSSNYIVGKHMMQQLMAERSKQQGEDFTLQQFFDDFMSNGIIPISLTRWELTGFEDQKQFLKD